MGRPRKSDAGLPPYVYFKSGAYRYQPPNAPGVTLGKSYPDALRAYADLVDDAAPVDRMSEVFDRFERTVLPDKKTRQRDNYLEALPRLRAVFGKMRPRAVTSPHVWQFFEERGRTTAAHHDVMALSHVFTWAIRWGIVLRNPCYQMRLERKKKTAPGYVTDTEFARARAAMPPQIQCAMDIALHTGLRMADILALERRHLSDDGIAVTTSKTGVPLLIAWSPELRAAVDRALGLPPHVRQTIIAKPTARGRGKVRAGQPYTESGFGSVWQKHIVEAYPEGSEGRWSFRRLRAKSASDENDIGAARLRLGHTSEAMTRRYIQKPQLVTPLRRG